MTPIVVVGLVGFLVLVAGLLWLLYQLFRGQSRLVVKQEYVLDQLQDLERALMSLSPQAGQQAPPALGIGADAPEFSLPDLSGRERTLQEFLGGPLVVAFFSPSCSFCLDMAPRLGQLPENGPRVLVISRGGADENRRLAVDHKWGCDVLLDSKGEAAQAYGATGTPTGYRLDADGRVASELAVGAEALLALVKPDEGVEKTLTAESLREKQDAAFQRAQKAGLSLTESHLNRQGLEPGAKAPEFVLPDLDGKKRSLASFLDKSVLLVFSDPQCGPCDALAPELVRLHEAHRDDGLRVVMVSRGDPIDNRAKAHKHGFPFPVLLQRHWEVSKDFAMFATPIAYLIDRSGTIAKPVAVGRNAILGLVEPS
jgi:peroxiredoxin